MKFPINCNDYNARLKKVSQGYFGICLDVKDYAADIGSSFSYSDPKDS